MKFDPHPFQQIGIEHAVDFLLSAPPNGKQLYASPTGSGKSLVELKVQEALNAQGADCWIVTPREEIIVGMLDKLGAPKGADSLEYRIATPVTLRNRLRDGVYRPTHFLFDEGHHHNATTWQQLDLLTGFAPAAAYTATPYRGTPKSTREFRETWGEPLWLITLQEAAELGYIRLPRVEVLPLVDDDIIDVRAGEFDVESVESLTLDRMGDLARHAAEEWYDRAGPQPLWTLPTVFATPSSRILEELQRALAALGAPMACVTAATPRDQRQRVFAAAEAGIIALGNIDVVSEGVDLKLRRYVDLAPTMSPVKFMQRFGRITRPWHAEPHYVCTNRNVLRHCYALEGAISLSAVVQADRAFPPTQRAHGRVLGMEAIGRFKPAATKLLSGLTAYTYSLSVVLDTVVVEYCCLVHPALDPIWAHKVNTVEDGERKYGSWKQCDPPNDMRGFASIASREPSPKQRAWWDRSAARHGLDPEQELTRKSFQALPVLADLGVRLP